MFCRSRSDATINIGKYMSEATPKDGPFDAIPMIVTGLQEELGLKPESRRQDHKDQRRPALESIVRNGGTHRQPQAMAAL